MLNKNVFLIISFVLIISITSALPQEKGSPINHEIDYSLIPTVNNTEHFGGYTVITLYDYYKSLFDLVYAPISEPLSLHLNQDNWYDDPDGWWYYDEGTKTGTFNKSKLTTTFYNATTGTAIRGTIEGTIELTQHPTGNYDTITFNITEESGSVGLDLRVNFTIGNSFNKGYIRYKTSSLSGDSPAIQLWDYDESEWEGGYGFLSETEDFLQYTNDILDDDSHLSGGIVQVRLYKSANGNTNNNYYIDMLAIVDGYATPSGNVNLEPYVKKSDLNQTIQNLSLNETEGDKRYLMPVSDEGFGSYFKEISGETFLCEGYIG